MRELEVTLTFKVLVDGLRSLDGLETELNQDGYSDGRKDFSLEMMEVALQRRMEGVINRTIHHQKFLELGKEMVQTSESGSTSRAALEAMEELRGVKVYVPTFDRAEIQEE